jgi:hypothetical protein
MFGIVILMKSQPHLSKIVAADRLGRAIAYSLNRWQRQPYDNTDDGNDDEQFQQGESNLATSWFHTSASRSGGVSREPPTADVDK